MAIRLSGMISGLDTEAMVKELMSAQSMKKTAIEQNKKKLEWKKEKWEEMNTKIYSLYTEKLSALRLEGSYLTKKVTSSDEGKAKATATNAVNGVYNLTVEKLATAEYVTGADISSKGLKKGSKLSDAGMTVGQTITVRSGEDLADTTTITVTDDLTLEGLATKLRNAGLNATFDEDSGRFYVSAKDSGAKNRFTMESDAAAGSGLDAIGLGNIDEELARTGRAADDSSMMAVMGASDMKAVLNGAVIEGSSNVIDANGLHVELTGTTQPGEVISLTISNDVDAVYDKIKDFCKSYNELLKEMDTRYSAASTRAYAMLTDEDKEAMSDEQVELWENKIKDSLLRRDDTLNSVMTSFRTAMQGTAEVDGKSYALSSFGIVTGEYTEHGLLHINGDKDDGLYATKEDSLRKSLEEDPELVGKVMSKLMGNLYSSLTKQMSANSLSSALTFYNDVQIKNQMDDYEKQISSWEDRLTTMEDKYYKQFSQMESAMAKLQSQQSQLSGLLGISS